MRPFSGARWMRSQSAPPCPGAWSYRILGRFPLSTTSAELERQQQQQQQEQQVAVPQARLHDGTVQPHPPGCCIHPQYGHLNAPSAIPTVPADPAHNQSICSGYNIPANSSYAFQSPYHQQPCASRCPPQCAIRDYAHVHPTPHGTYHQSPPQVHSHCVYPPPAPPSGHQFPAPPTDFAGVPQRPGFVYSHSYSGHQHSDPPNEAQYHNPHDPRPPNTQYQHHRHPHGAQPPGIPQGPTWNAVNSEQAGSGSGSRASHAQPRINVPLEPEGQGTFGQPFITLGEGPNLIFHTSPGRPPHSTIGNVTAGAGSVRKQQEGESQKFPPTSTLSNSSLQPQPHPAPRSNTNTRTNAFSTTRNPAPKRTRKSYTREYKLKALNLLNSERPDGKGGVVPASDTWVSRQVGVTRKVLRGWKAQEERLRASRKGSRRVRVGRNRERRPAGSGKERSDRGKGKEVEARGAPSVMSAEDGMSCGTPKSPPDIETSSEDEDTEIGTPAERHSTEGEGGRGNEILQQSRATRAEAQVNIS